MGAMFKTAAMAIITAVVAVVITYVIADAISGPPMATPPGGDAVEEVTLGGAVVATVIGGIVGTILAFISSRLGRPVQIFTGLCVVGLIVYGIVAFAAADDSTSGLWLNIMHLAAAVPIVGGLARWLGGSGR